MLQFFSNFFARFFFPNLYFQTDESAATPADFTFVCTSATRVSVPQTSSGGVWFPTLVEFFQRQKRRFKPKTKKKSAADFIFGGTSPVRAKHLYHVVAPPPLFSWFQKAATRSHHKVSGANRVKISDQTQTVRVFHAPVASPAETLCRPARRPARQAPPKYYIPTVTEENPQETKPPRRQVRPVALRDIPRAATVPARAPKRMETMVVAPPIVPGHVQPEPSENDFIALLVALDEI